jgi:hypothetical protein
MVQTDEHIKQIFLRAKEALQQEGEDVKDIEETYKEV